MNIYDNLQDDTKKVKILLIGLFFVIIFVIIPIILLTYLNIYPIPYNSNILNESLIVDDFSDLEMPLKFITMIIGIFIIVLSVYILMVINRNKNKNNLE